MSRLFVTMGDPRGIGPEVALKALAEGSTEGVRLVGSRKVFGETARMLGLDDLFHRLEPDLLDIAGPVGAVGIGGPGRAGAELPGAVAGAWAGSSIEAAVRALRPGRDALVTGPVDKAALIAGGHPYPGHTEMLAALAGSPRVAMMLVSGDLRVSLVTGHVPLRAVPDLVRPERIADVFRLTHHALRTGFDVGEPRIAVCGLNPHAGDQGALGDEDFRVVTPAVRGLAAEGFAVQGPIPADTVFVRAIAGEFDAVLALYHDQGMIPVKVHGFGGGVNVTLGLPFVRTSPDHGTALDIAGRGRARSESFGAALALARELVGRPEFVAAPVVKAASVQ